MIIRFSIIAIVAAISATTYPPPPYIDSECCTLKVVGGLEYEIVGKISNPGHYKCLNGCTYAVVGGNSEIQYCFKHGHLPAECKAKEETKFTTTTTSATSTTTTTNTMTAKAILVTGGYYTGTSAELLFTNGTSMCHLPQMSQWKQYHTQSGRTACGGMGSDTDRSSITFEDGSWTTLKDNLYYERYKHSSWITPDGDILLIGGESFFFGTTTEIVYQNGTSITSFDLKYNTVLACSIELPEMFILTGGENTQTTVSQYTTSGWMEDLPQLNEGRWDHGCGFFYNDDMQRVFLVAGGYTGSSHLSSTETLVEGGQAWTFQQPLPSERDGLCGISLPDTVVMTGGYDDSSSFDDVLAYDTESSDWKKIGSLKTARYHHGASLVNINDVIDFCI